MTPETPSSLWRRVAAFLRRDADPSATPDLDARLIVGHALGLAATGLVVHAARPVDGSDVARCMALAARRAAGEPVARITGAKGFWTLDLALSPETLVPRPDTETLVDVALARTAHVSLSMRLLDLCTGSGCVAITLARQRPTAKVLASDVSPDALAVARENAYRLGAYNVAFVESDLFANIPAGSRFDVITANPPYIATAEIEGLAADIRDYEPRGALDGGADGLDLVRKIVDDAPAFLDDGGVLAIEIGAGEAPDTGALFEARGYVDIAVERDYGKIERVVSGVRPRG